MLDKFFPKQRVVNGQAVDTPFVNSRAGVLSFLARTEGVTVDQAFPEKRVVTLSGLFIVAFLAGGCGACAVVGLGLSGIWH